MNPLTIGVVGPCGAGKSSIVKLFGGFPGVFVIEEPVAATDSCFQPYDELDMPQIQREFILAPTKEIVPPNVHTVVRDRIENEHMEVFIPMHKALGGLSGLQANQLLRLAERVKRQLAPPSAFLVVTAPREVLLTRIGASRPPWLVEAFDRQLQLYREMMCRLSGPSLFIDTSIVAKDALPQVAEWVLHTFVEVCQGRSLPSNRGLGLQWTVL